MANYYKALTDSIDVAPSETSYFSQASTNLDPRLFANNSIKPKVRSSILSLITNSLITKYQGVEAWMRAWLAGSGVSYNWTANRQPADLDCLVGVDFTGFRRANTQYQGFSDKEIADMINEDFRSDVHPQTENFLGAFDLTFYVNTKSNIVDIKPYAAYSLTDNTWTVPPSDLGTQHNPEWDAVMAADVSHATDIVNRYKTHYQGVRNAPNDAIRRNHEVALHHTLGQAAALFDEIHEGRKHAFSSAGEGYADFTNYRWQSGKQAGIIQPLKQLKDAHQTASAGETYGLSLPSADIMVRRAASQYIQR